MAKPPAKKSPRIFILSGGTGRTAEQLLRAALSQFPGSDVQVAHHPKIRSMEKAISLIKEASSQGAVVYHSFVVHAIRRAVAAEVTRLGVPCVDVLGPSLAVLSDHLSADPRGQAGMLYALHHEQFDRMDAMDFTLAHDDGKRLEGIKLADVVLVGASRTSKSVTCFYLAFRGIRAANVPLFWNQPPPVELTRISPKRVIGLTMNAAHLESIRQSRLPHLSNRPVPRYSERQDIQTELRDIRMLMAHQKWECIDVSYQATEEVAARIIEMLPRRRRSRSQTRTQDRSI